MKTQSNDTAATGLIFVVLFIIAFFCMLVLPRFQSEESKQAEITKAQRQSEFRMINSK